jgi:putative exosortase-associated protein (TIGR04073 family)
MRPPIPKWSYTRASIVKNKPGILIGKLLTGLGGYAMLGLTLKSLWVNLFRNMRRCIVASSKHTIVKIVVVLLVAAFCVQSIPASAQDFDSDLDLPQKTKLERSMTKLGRGLQNIFLGWAEIPTTFNKKLKEGKPLGYLLGVAPVLGTARAVIRTGAGVYETVTFPSSPPEVNFEPLVAPEYIF